MFMNFKKFSGLCLIIGLIILVSGCTQSEPSGQVTLAHDVEEAEPGEVNTQSNEVECREVAYSEEECGTITLEYSRTGEESHAIGSSWIGPYRVECTINNLDNEAGEFTVEIGAMNEENEWVKKQLKKTVTANGSETFSETVSNVKPTPYYCQEVPPLPTKEVCEEVTKYREECN